MKRLLDNVGYFQTILKLVSFPDSLSLLTATFVPLTCPEPLNLCAPPKCLCMSLDSSNGTSPFDLRTLSKCLYGSNRPDLKFILFYSSLRFSLDDHLILLFFLLLLKMYCQPY